MSPGRTLPSGTGPASIIVTSSPRSRQVAATSAPMNPAPMTATRAGPASSSARSARQSSMVRSTCTPSGSSGRWRGAAPMASTIPSAATVEPSDSVTDRVAGVERRGGDAQTQVDVQLGQTGGRAVHRAVGLPVAGQHLLRQRRPVGRQLRATGRRRRAHRRSRRCAARSVAVSPASDAPTTRMGDMVGRRPGR